jgi:hypothetical protein
LGAPASARFSRGDAIEEAQFLWTGAVHLKQTVRVYKGGGGGGLTGVKRRFLAEGRVEVVNDVKEIDISDNEGKEVPSSFLNNGI